jgi:hypothetical protein
MDHNIDEQLRPPAPSNSNGSIDISVEHHQALQSLASMAQALVDQNVMLWNELSNLKARLNNHVPPIHQSIRAKAPTPFSGEKRYQLDTFLNQCRLCFLVSPESFVHDQHKILYAASYLEGIAYSWFEPLLQSYEKYQAEPAITPCPSAFMSFTAFATAMITMFGDPDLERNKTRELKALKQLTSVAAYASEFLRLKSYIDWNDKAFYDSFYEGLQDDVKDNLVLLETRPHDLDSLIQKSQQIDIRIAERIIERKSNTHPVTPRKPFQPPVKSTSSLSFPSAKAPAYSPSSPQSMSLNTLLFSVSSIPTSLASQHGFIPLHSVLRYHPRLHIIIELEIWNGKRWITTFAMIDSGAAGNFISSFYLRSFFERSLPKAKARPYYLAMANGKSNVVSRECLTQIKIQEHHEHLSLDSTILESYPIILGIPWLKRHDPWIHWSSHRITFNSPYCLSQCHLNGPLTITSLPRFPSRSVLVKPNAPTPTPQRLAPNPSNNHDSLSSINPPQPRKPGVRWKPDSQIAKIVEYDPLSSPSALSSSKSMFSKFQSPQVNQVPSCVNPVPSSNRPSSNQIPSSNRLSSINQVSSRVNKVPSSINQVSSRANKVPSSINKVSFNNQVPSSNKAPPNVSLIGAAPFSYLLKQRDVQLFQLDVSQISSPAETDLSNVPEEYHEFAKVFSKEESDKLPEHRPYDHKIPLQPDTAPPYGPIYSLSPEELKTLRQYIDDNLRKGFIRNSQSPCAAPILFVKKPDGSLRLCVDYRGLNKITVKNRYPLPLINELFDRLRNAKYFTKLDMRDGYYRLRMAEGEEWKTAFRTRYGLYEYTVMPFGLCNAPGTFQYYVNDVFRDYLDDFMSAYLDDLLIYSKDLKEHKKHVRQVLQRLEENQLYLKGSKCQFHQTEISFLGYIISEAGISMDSAKVEAVTSWPIPASVLDVQIFLGLANFYRRFIKNFSKIISPITRLLKKDVQFSWGKSANNAFKALKKAFTSAPVLRHFDFNRPAVVETDASDFAEGGVISQRDDDGNLHPVAFFSRKFLPAELNYEIYDKEMLAIVDCLTIWRHYLQGSGNPVEVITDHKNLLWFTETKMYNRRQARWAEKLSHFDFFITYRPGAQGGKPDALSRRPDHRPQKGGGAYKNPNEFQFLKPHQLKNFPLEEAPQMIASLMATTDPEPEVHPDLFKDIKQSLLNDQIGEYLQYITDPTLERPKDLQEYLRPYTTSEDGIVLKRGLVYVPNNDLIKLQLLRTHHDSPLAGHPGQEKTYELLSRNYTWPNMRQFVNEYINTCDTCTRNKSPRQRPHGPLMPLPIPSGPWKSVSMDFIVELPPSNGFNAIYVCVDRFTKMAHFTATTTEVTAEDTASSYLRNIFRLHGLPTDIVSDRGPQFTSKFTKALLRLCDIKGNLSTAFHPQSDGQTERVNQVLEQYLRIFCHYQQDDWYDLLPLAEFAYNNAKHASTQVSPFYANYGYHPRMSIADQFSHDQGMNPTAHDFAKRLERIHQDLIRNLREAQAKYKERYDAKIKDPPLFKVGDLVWLSRKYISTNRPSSKLDYKRLGPFKILKVVGEAKSAYKLELPAQMRIHPVFHVSLLSPYRANTIPGRQQAPAPPPIVIDGNDEWELEKILDSRIHYRKLQYYVDWKGYTPAERTWEPADCLANAPELVKEYHRQFPQRPSPKDVPKTLRRSSAPRRGGTVTN